MNTWREKRSVRWTLGPEVWVRDPAGLLCQLYSCLSSPRSIKSPPDPSPRSAKGYEQSSHLSKLFENVKQCACDAKFPSIQLYRTNLELHKFSVYACKTSFSFAPVLSSLFTILIRSLKLKKKSDATV